MTKTRRRFKQTTTLEDRLATFAQDAREKASLLPAGVERQALLKKARQADEASQLNHLISPEGRTTK